jgi:putative serine protease PepD
VVQVVAYVEQDGHRIPAWQGSGIVLSKDGLILTSNSIARPGKPFTVSDLLIAVPGAAGEPARPAYYAEILQANSALDLAVLRIVRDINNQPVDRAALQLPYATLGDSDALQPGSDITLLGFGPGEGASAKSVRTEVASFRAAAGVSQRAFGMLAAPLEGSFDGAAAVDENGELVGIATSGAFDGEGQSADCRPLYDSNRDGAKDAKDRCGPGLLKVGAFRPLRLA